MLVKIKPYPKHRWYHNWLYNTFGYSKKQKVSVRIDSYDTWGMDSTLAHIILPMLKQLKETKQGSPIVDDKDVPHMPKQSNARNESVQYDLFASDEQDALCWDQYEQRWDYVLNEMIWAFEQKVRDDWEADYITGEYDILFKEIDEGYSEMVKGPNHTVVTDTAGLIAHQERMSNGFRLLGVYWENLWD